MAYPQSRSCNQDLHAGMTDGAYKRAAPNRGGILEHTSCAVRQQMSGVWHGFNETQMKVLPDGRPDHPPYYHDIAPLDRENV